MIEITSRLPAGYQEVEYIESSGTQYINTGFMPNHNARVVLDAYIEVSSSLRSLFGYRNSSSANSFTVWQFASYLRTDYGTSATEMTSFSPPNRLVVDKNKAVTNLNGTEYTNKEQTFTSEGNLALFAMNHAGSVSGFCVGKIYSCQIYDNGTQVRDFVPCYRKADSVAGLYDLVNGAFYTNAGSGTFAVGADVGSSIVVTAGGIIPQKYALRRRIRVQGKKYFTVTLTGDFGHTTLDTRSVYINGIEYDAVQTLSVEEGTPIKVTVQTYGSAESSMIYFNGALMKIASWNETNPNSYSFVLTNNATINAQKAGHTSGAFYTACSVRIVM